MGNSAGALHDDLTYSINKKNTQLLQILNTNFKQILSPRKKKKKIKKENNFNILKFQVKKEKKKKKTPILQKLKKNFKKNPPPQKKKKKSNDGNQFHSCKVLVAISSGNLEFKKVTHVLTFTGKRKVYFKHCPSSR